MGMLADKKILITGLLSNRSIAYGIARACRREGATLAFNYVNADLKDRVVKLATDFGSAPVVRLEDSCGICLPAYAKGVLLLNKLRLEIIRRGRRVLR